MTRLNILQNIFGEKLKLSKKKGKNQTNTSIYFVQMQLCVQYVRSV